MTPNTPRATGPCLTFCPRPQPLRVRSARPIGFTLIELLVVVGIISLLVSILVPSLGKARAIAKSSVCMSNMRQWGIATHVFANQNRDQTPLPGEPLFAENNGGEISYAAKADGDSSKKPIGYWDDTRFWINALPPLMGSAPYWKLQDAHTRGDVPLPYVNSESIFVCPAAVEPDPNGNDSLTSDGYFKTYGYAPEVGGVYNPNSRTIVNPPSGAVARATFITYAWNSKYTQSQRQVLMSQIVQPGATVMLMEKRTNNSEVPKKVNEAYQIATGRAPDAAGGRLLGRTLSRIKGDWQRFTARHPKESGNLLFADGHVAGFSYLEIVQNPSWGFGTTLADFNLPSVQWNPFGRAQEN